MRDSERCGTSLIGGARTQCLLRRNWCWRQVLMWLLLMAVGSVGMSHAKQPVPQPEALIDRIWTSLPPPKRPLSGQDQTYAEAALTQWLQAYLRREYDVVDQRFFWSERNSSQWVAISKSHASRIGGEDSPWRGVEIDQEWNEIGLDLVRLWKVEIDGVDHYFAVAMTDQPVPGTRGRRLIGRFELKKAAD